MMDNSYSSLLILGKELDMATCFCAEGKKCGMTRVKLMC